MPGKRKTTVTHDRSYTPCSKNREVEKNTPGCIFCFSDDDREDIFGMYIKNDVLRAHSNCLYLASGLSQKGDESDEYLGFLLPDIQAEVNRGKKLNCSYCKKKGATIGCAISSCRKSFHLNCGIENGSLHQFFGSFCSYCFDHKPRQPRLHIDGELSCHICKEPIGSNELEGCLYPPCCKRNLFHKICLQRSALSAGAYYFKCPLCKNKEEFISEMKKFGLNIPIKDASWELEENAYEELLARPECDAPICECPQGRSYHPDERSPWALITCSYCGFHARHKRCENIKKTETAWLCEECSEFNDKIAIKKACCEIEDKSDSCNKNLCLTPKVVLQKMTDIDTHCDISSNSRSHTVKLYQSKSAEADSGSEEMPVIAGSSKQLYIADKDNLSENK